MILQAGDQPFKGFTWTHSLTHREVRSRELTRSLNGPGLGTHNPLGKKSTTFTNFPWRIHKNGIFTYTTLPLKKLKHINPSTIPWIGKYTEKTPWIRLLGYSKPAISGARSGSGLGFVVKSGFQERKPQVLSHGGHGVPEWMLVVSFIHFIGSWNFMGLLRNHPPNFSV